MRTIRILYDEGAPPAPVTPPAPPAAPAALPADFNYVNHLPEEIRAEPTFAKYKTLEDLGRGLLSAQKMIGRDPNSMVEVRDNLTPEERRGVFERFGLPKDAGAYKLEPVEGGVPWLAPDQPLAKGLVAKASEFGLFPDQVSGLYKWFTSEIAKTSKEQQAGFAQRDAEAIGQLRSEWGQTFDANVQSANLAVEKLGGKEFRDLLNGSGLGAHPGFIKAMAKIGELFAEPGSGGKADGSGGFGTGMAPAEAKAKAMDLLRQASTAKHASDRARLNEEAQKYFARAG